MANNVTRGLAGHAARYTAALPYLEQMADEADQLFLWARQQAEAAAFLLSTEHVAVLDE